MGVNEFGMDFRTIEAGAYHATLNIVINRLLIKHICVYTRTIYVVHINIYTL